MQKNRYHLSTVVAISIVAVFFSCQNSSGEKKISQKAKAMVAARVGFSAPNFTLPDLDGNQVSLDDLKGNIVMLNFWATWCGPCKMEMPAMEELYKKLKGKKFKMLAVSNDYQGKQIVQPYIEREGFTFPVLIDSDMAINDIYRITSIPTTILVDQNGIITNKFFGARNWSSPRYEDLIVKLINSES